MFSREKRIIDNMLIIVLNDFLSAPHELRTL